MHWRNSEFQIRHFLAGKCHTPDEAYRLLRELEEEREDALKAAEVSFERLKARMEVLNSAWRAAAHWLVPGMRTRSHAETIELTHNVMRMADLVTTANRELTYIRELIAEVEPQRKYRHLPDPEAHQAAQAEEWLLELKTRIENYVVGMGTVPPEQLDVMRLHPAWHTELLPHLKYVRELVLEFRVDELPVGQRVLLKGKP